MSFNALLSKIRTTEERDTMVAALRHLVASLYQDHKDIQAQLRQFSVSHDQLDALNKLLQESDDTKKLLPQLLDGVNALEVVELTLAIVPSELILDHIHQEIITMTGRSIVLSIRVDPALVGGMIISFKGKYLDISLKKEAQAYLQSQKPAIVKKLKELIKTK